MSDPLYVLISLYRGYGLGDGVQMSAVLRHLAKYRPNWCIDYRADEGRHQVARGIVNDHFAYGTPQDPSTASLRAKRYDLDVEIRLYDTWANWGDRPNTRVSSCLHEVFGLGWDAECGRYRVEVRPESAKAARTLLVSDRCVAIHYEGDSSPGRKNLTHQQASEICQVVERAGYLPVVLDWRRRCPLSVRRIGVPQEWGRDAEMVCAVIGQCKRFIGIDSGPSKCASATDTPALVIWTGHHPAPFHDPAPNTTHLVPRGYHGLEPVCSDSAVMAFFKQHYNVMEYGDGNITEGVMRWIGL